MFCPRCGSNQSEELKFCKSCGANLNAVRQVIDTRETPKKFDWGDTWVAEMFLSGEEAEKRKVEMERRRGLTPAVKRYNEIKAGVITSSVGLAIAILLFVLMEGIILGGNVQPDTAEILSRIWIAGILPLFVGIALIINGLFVSKRLVEIANQAEKAGPNTLDSNANPRSLGAADTSEFIPSSFSVTEGTTKHLKNSGAKP